MRSSHLFSDPHINQLLIWFSYFKTLGLIYIAYFQSVSYIPLAFRETRQLYAARLLQKLKKTDHNVSRYESFQNY